MADKRLAGEAVEGARLALLGGPAAEPLGPFAFALVGFGEPGDHVFDFALGGFAAADLDGPKGIAERGLFRPSDGFSHQGGFAGGGGTGGAEDGSRQVGLGEIEERGHAGALHVQVGDEVAELVGFGKAGDAVEGVLRGAGEDGFAGALHRQTRVGVLDEGEMGG